MVTDLIAAAKQRFNIFIVTICCFGYMGSERHQRLIKPLAERCEY